MRTCVSCLAAFLRVRRSLLLNLTRRRTCECTQVSVTHSVFLNPFPATVIRKYASDVRPLPPARNELGEARPCTQAPPEGVRRCE